MSQKTRIVAAVVDTARATLYKQDGTTIVIEQGDPRLRRILDEAIPQLKAQKWADVWIDLPGDNDYAKMEEKTNGLVKFFRVAKKKLHELFGGGDEPVAPTYVGVVPASPDAAAVTAPVNGGFVHGEYVPPQQTVLAAEVRDTISAVEEIMKHAVPASSGDFNEKTVSKQANVIDTDGSTSGAHTDDSAPDTIIAMVDGKVIPGMEKIKSQFTHALKLGSTTGVENFLKRLGSVIEKRSHSVEDLLKFMERGDLPIADDGSILIYKVLRRKDGNNDGRFVDCHTRKVEQFVGAYVVMDEKLVDHNRNNECSNGLHVARRGYVRGFSGDVCVLAKLAPEDVITVPSYDANKMRVCGYHIIAELSKEQYSNLCSNRPITDKPEGQKLLASALAGLHIGRTHEVRITKQNGEGVVTKELEHQHEEVLVAPAPAPAATMADVPAQLVSDAAEAIEQHGEDELERYAEQSRTTETGAAQVRLVKVEALPDVVEQSPSPVIDPLQVVKQVEAAPSRKDVAKKLYDSYIDHFDSGRVEQSQKALEELLAFKKAAKVGWDKLGIPDPVGKAKPVAKPAAKPAAKKAPAKKAAPAKPVKPVKQAKPVKAKQVEQVELDGEQDRRGLDLSDDPKTGSPRQRIHALLALGKLTPDTAKRIVEIKRKAKKSWYDFGLTSDIIDAILKLSKGK